MGLRWCDSAWVRDPARCSRRRVIPADVPRCATPLPGRSIIPVPEAVVMHAPRSGFSVAWGAARHSHWLRRRPARLRRHPCTGFRASARGGGHGRRYVRDSRQHRERVGVASRAPSGERNGAYGPADPLVRVEPRRHDAHRWKCSAARGRAHSRFLRYGGPSGGVRRAGSADVEHSGQCRIRLSCAAHPLALRSRGGTAR